MSFRQLPQGMQDFLPDECFNKQLLQQRLAELYAGYGLACVDPCAIEFCRGGEAYSSCDHLFKFTDSDGRLLALRSDPTVQLARIAVTRLGGKARVYYMLNSYEFLSSLTSPREREFAQAGVELIGGSPFADLEAVVLAIESLLAIGVQDFKLDIGDVRFLQGITSGLTSAQIDAIYSVIDNSRLSDVLNVCLSVGVDAATADKICAALDLFGGVEVLKQGRALANNPVSVQAVDSLIGIYNALDGLGYSDYVSFDLGFTAKNYYTGLVVRGYAKGYGLTLLEGGRYDNLCAAFGDNVNAVGFCIGIRRALACIKPQLPSPPMAVYVSDQISAPLALFTVRALRERGVVLRLDSVEDAVEYCRANGVCTLLVFENGVKREVRL